MVVKIPIFGVRIALSPVQRFSGRVASCAAVAFFAGFLPLFLRIRDIVTLDLSMAVSAGLIGLSLILPLVVLGRPMKSVYWMIGSSVVFGIAAAGVSLATSFRSGNGATLIAIFLSGSGMAAFCFFRDACDEREREGRST